MTAEKTTVPTSRAGTDLSREILGEVSGEQPGTSTPGTVAGRVQQAIDQGADLDSIRRRFHLSESELRDYCSDIMDDGFDEPTRDSGTGY